MSNETKRGSVLSEAIDVINGERQNVYGNPEDSFALVAGYWNTYLVERQKKILSELGFDIHDYVLVHLLAPNDVAMMMTLFKIAREANQHKRDNIRDASGYLGIYADMCDVTVQD